MRYWRMAETLMKPLLRALISADAPLIKVLIDVMAWIWLKSKAVIENGISQFEELKKLFAHVCTEELLIF